MTSSPVRLDAPDTPGQPNPTAELKELYRGFEQQLLVPLWTYLAWGDKPAWWTLVGGGLILVGLAIRYTSPKKSASSDR